MTIMQTLGDYLARRDAVEWVHLAIIPAPNPYVAARSTSTVSTVT